MTIEMITGNPWFSLVSLAITTASLAAAVIFYRKSRRDKVPCFSVTRESIIENSAPLIAGLSVQFNGEVQKVITVAKVAFWNHGAETIGGQDRAKAKPLEIVVDNGVDVLNATVLKSTDDANQFRIGEPQKQEDGRTTIPITFDFLDRSDGALFQVVHNGEERTRVWVEGKIKGADDPLHQGFLPFDRLFVRSMARMTNLHSFIVVAFSIYLVFGLGLVFLGIIYPSARIAIVPGVLLIVMVGLLGVTRLAGRTVRPQSIPLMLSPLTRTWTATRNSR